MRQTIPIPDLQRQRILGLHTELHAAQRKLDLFCDAVLTGHNIDTAQVVDLTPEGLVIELPDPAETVI